MPRHPFLIADIRGTNARFALVSHEPPYFMSAQSFQCADYANSLDAVDRYLEINGISAIAGICFAVAGIVNSTTVDS